MNRREFHQQAPYFLEEGFEGGGSGGGLEKAGSLALQHEVENVSIAGVPRVVSPLEYYVTPSYSGVPVVEEPYRPL